MSRPATETAATVQDASSPRLRIVFMGTPTFSVPALEKIHSAHEIVAVYTQPDRPVGRGLEVRQSPVKEKALSFGLPVYQPEKLSLPGEYEKLAELKPDVIVVVAYGQILRQNVLDLPRIACVNIHSSLLPRWRGAAPIHHAMLAGDTVTGVTTMKMVRELDAGDIYEQVETKIGEREFVGVLHDRLAVLGGDLILSTIEGLASGRIEGRAQDPTKVTYATKLTKEMEALDPKLAAAELDRRVRALNPWPGTSLFLATAEGKPEERIKVRQTVPHPTLAATAGYLQERAGTLVLGTAQGALEIQRLQPEGKKEMDSSSFLNGLKGRGIRLPLPVRSG
ncbi:MAG: methionyl-tRNA formyltransferase [Bdellovibrionales bacterium]|nr:methionyl-tRNA formyltransferase [Bdellovibrionales bacterium]